MIEELTIPREELNLIQVEFEANKPYEACGVMIGTISGTMANVKKVIPVTNIRHSAISFELDSQQFYIAWNNAEKSGNEIVGIYHTHPASSGIYSSWDRDTMKEFPSVWLIAGVNGIFGYVYDDGIKNVRILIKETGKKSS